MNLYHVLGVSDDASDDEIRIAYKNLARIHHPDKNNSEESKEKFHEIHFSAILIISFLNRFYAIFLMVSKKMVSKNEFFIEG